MTTTTNEISVEIRTQVINDFIDWLDEMSEATASKLNDLLVKETSPFDMITKSQPLTDAIDTYARASGAAETYLEHELRQPIDGVLATEKEIADYERFKTGSAKELEPFVRPERRVRKDDL